MKPSALKKSAAQADEMIKAAAARRAVDPATAPVRVAQEIAQPPQEPPAEFGRDQNAAPAEPAMEPPARAVAEPPKDDFEQKYRVLQGKYNAEIPRAREEAQRAREEEQRAREERDELRRQMADMQRQMEELRKKPAAPLVTDKEREEFGEDLLDVAARNTLSRPEIADLIEANHQLRAELAQIKAKVDSTSAGVVKTSRERMFDYLDATVAGWRETNVDGGFLRWLDQEDGLIGATRLSLLHRAFEANDAKRVARFFTAYASETGRDAKSAKLDPKDFVSVGKGLTPPPAKPEPEQIIWTPEDISAFYRDVQKGVFAKNPDEKARLERDIFAAQREGRIAQ